jgi:hypothetical protein
LRPQRTPKRCRLGPLRVCGKDRIISYLPAWCPTCQAHITSAVLLHHSNDYTGELHSVEPEGPDGRIISGATNISSFTRTNWNPGGLQWAGPGTYIVAVDPDTNTQLAEVRVIHAIDKDGNDETQKLRETLALALESHYEPHVETSEKDQLVQYAWMNPAAGIEAEPAIKIRVLVRAGDNPRQIGWQLEHALSRMVEHLVKAEQFMDLEA